MVAIAIVLTVLLLLLVIVYGRAIVYAFSDEYKLEQRIRQFTKQ